MNIKNGFLVILFILAVFLVINLQKYAREYYSSPEEPELSINNFSTPRFPAPDFTLSDLRGNATTLSNYQGSVVLIMFWTTWWPTCKKALPSIETLNQREKEEDLKILLINLKEKKETISSFVNRKKYSSSVLLDENGTVAENYSVYGIPISFLIDKRGEIVFQFLGSLDWESEKMVSIVNNLIDEWETQW